MEPWRRNESDGLDVFFEILSQRSRGELLGDLIDFGRPNETGCIQALFSVRKHAIKVNMCILHGHGQVTYNSLCRDTPSKVLTKDVFGVINLSFHNISAQRDGLQTISQILK